MVHSGTPEGGTGAVAPLDRRVPACLAIGAAILLGTWLRVSLGLGGGLWRDEVQSLAISRLPSLGELLRFLVREESHPPLFYFIERAWTSLAGTSDAAVAALGLIPGVLLIPAAAAVAWRWSGPWGGVLAAWLVALAWPLLWHGADGRPYALLTLVLLGCAAAARTAIEGRSRRAWAAYALAGIAAAYLHNWALLVMGSLVLLTLEAAWGDRRSGSGQLRDWAGSHAAMVLAYLPWAPALLRQTEQAGYPPLSGFPVEWLVMMPLALLGLSVSLLPLAVIALAVGAWGGWTSGPPKSARFFGAAAVLPWLLAAAVWPVTFLTVGHCGLMLTPLALVAVAVLLSDPTSSRSAAVRRRVAALLFVACVAVAGLGWRVGKSNLRGTVEFLNARAEPGDLVLIYPSTLAPSFRRYAAVDVEVETFPPRMASGPTRFSTYSESFEDRAALEEVLRRIPVPGSPARRTWLLSQLRKGAAGDSLALVGTMERWRHNYDAGLGEISGRLRALYGAPIEILLPAVGTGAREQVRLEAFGAARR